MIQSRWFKILHSLGLEFWLPLPLLGLAFWVGSGFVMDWVISRSNQTTKYLKVDSQSTKQPNIIIMSIKAEINKSQGISKVKVKTVSSVLQALEFEFPITELTLLEAAISQELRLPIENVRELMQNKNIEKSE
ncbi:hypothetical protein QUB80_26010 [Chlorogloeopsis sp. ULAP01]|uniref:hypothetical protein n=1 Tax=Chlorogloeopsis sp. ULAP01 TaxID=3056483 RepID=UPI0025AADB29|nr:hypothetical protein [Chlorogloeopsis sp. ULAP01]MDM9384135.1 hypothetical protein [Chlorogloeopsis sp. ULAP01]